MAQSPSGIPSTNNSVMSITRSGRTEPFDLQVARGQVAGHQVLSVFGYQPNVSATSIPIWENKLLILIQLLLQHYPVQAHLLWMYLPLHLVLVA